MHSNVEIKAVIRDIEHTISKATELSDTAQIKIEQHDTFFKAKDGRLKLRKFKVVIISINFSTNHPISVDKIYISILRTYCFLREMINNSCTFDVMIQNIFSYIL